MFDPMRDPLMRLVFGFGLLLALLWGMVLAAWELLKWLWNLVF